MNMSWKVQSYVMSFLGGGIKEIAHRNENNELRVFGEILSDVTFHKNLGICMEYARSSPWYTKMMPPMFSEQGRTFVKMWMKAFEETANRHRECMVPY